MKAITYIKKRNYLTLGLLFVAFMGFTQTQPFTSSGTFTVPAGVTSVTVEAWGGGGKGGSKSGNGNSDNYGGAGGGAYAKKVISVLSSLSPYTVTVGTGSATTAAGGDSWFLNNTTILAKGGSSVQDNTTNGAAGGLSSACIGTTVYSGGTGAGNLLNGGGGGSSAGMSLLGVTATTQTGATAPSGGGNGGSGGSGSGAGSNGSPGLEPGGGGGGGGKGNDGSQGGNGKVIVTWTCPTYNLTSTAIASPLCTTYGANVSLTSNPSGLPIGTYTVTYNIGGTNTATGRTTIMTVTTAGSGNFTTTPLANAGSTNITITNLASGENSSSNCASSINANNTANINITAVPAQPSTITGNSTAICPGSSQTYSVTSVAGVTYNWAFPAGWIQTAGGTTNSITVTAGSTSGNIQVTPSIACGSGTAQTRAITVTVLPTISISPGSRSGSGTVNLSATVSSGTINWYAASTGGLTLYTGTTFTTPSLSTTTTYYVELTHNSCISSTRTPVIATITGQEIDIRGNAVSIVSGDTTPTFNDWTNFGATQIQNDPIIKTFTILNTGIADINLTGSTLVSISGSTDFSLITLPTTPIKSSSSTTFQIQFNPNSLGLKTAIISIANNDSNENPYTFTIQGTGFQAFFDSDGDGVYDNIDVDDDNDGIKDVTEENNCTAVNGYSTNYKFLNETFGSVSPGSRMTISTTYDASTTYCYEDGTGTNCIASGASKILDDGEYCVVSKITGTTAGDPQNIHGDLAWYQGEDHTIDSNGGMAVFNASFTKGVFYQTTISGVLSNIPITYSFWVLNIMAQDRYAGTILPNITVEFLDVSGNILSTINTGDIGRCSLNTSDNTCPTALWQQFSTTVNLGNINTFTIRFKNNADGGSGNDLAIDDILIAQTLCDRDNDGIADLFDLDADNDGIEDVIEAGLGNLSNGKGKIDGTWVDTNGNGLTDSAEAAAALPALDSDDDGIPNYIDLDSDNDSLFDVDESGAGNTNAATGFLNGDGDINGDGRGDGPESEDFRSKDFNGDGIIEGFGDGILDMYDYGNGINQYGNLGQGVATGNPATTYLKDTDADGIPDYLDLKSNGSTFDIANTLLIYDYKALDTDNNGVIDGSTDIDKDGIRDTFDTNIAYFGSPRDMSTKLFLDFDGRNDYGQSTSILGGLANASLMAWIDLNPAFSTDGVIVGQDKFQIRINSTKRLEAVLNGSILTYDTTLNVSQWYNIGATYDGANLKLYLNGALVATKAATGAIAVDASLLTIGKDPITSTKYFKGKIDEVRVFNSALTDSQLQRMVYQEIQNSGSEIRGLIVPKNIATSPASLPFANLLRYYRMDSYKDDIIDDLTTPAIDVTGTKIFNHKNIYVQQAPMPFLTQRTGNFATAVNSPTNDIRGLDIQENDFSIVKVRHNISEPSNSVDLGMFVDSGVEILINNDNKLQNDWYLKLDGKIDLVGKSQLVQTTESDLELTSSGSIERDQQGQSNKFNYNYWSSPVSTINSTSNNSNYTVDGVLRDGTNPAAPVTINWVSGYDGSPTTPKISLARYWLYKFDNYSNLYANWIQILETAPIRVGQGFTLKGSGTTGLQNYTFIGKPNNGLINTNTVASDQLLLTGNPYASAIDATAFINDNSSSIDGTLYFWEHYSTNNTHILSDYQGGYAERNLTGGVPPTSAGVDFISSLGCSNRGIPNQYIPVGQGFFVNGKIGSGGTVSFKNSQRAFHKEDEAGVSNIMYKRPSSVTKPNHLTNNSNDPIVKDTLMKIRLGFNSNNKYHRQVLLGFMNEKATSELDYGYDGLNMDDFPNDMYFLNGENQLVIQGEGFFDANASYPIGVKTDVEGKVSFMIDALENFDKKQNIFIYDDETKTYNEIQNKPFEVNLPVGVTDTRFSLRFFEKTTAVENTLSVDDESETNNELLVFYSKNYKTLIIKNNDQDSIVNSASLFNILGQAIENWDVEDGEQTNIQIPIKNMPSGIYIVKVKTTKGASSKKIIIN